MIQRYSHKGLIWIDMEAPTSSEVASVIKEFDVLPQVGEELVTPTLKPKVDIYKNCIYLILHFPALGYDKLEDSQQEIDFVIGKHFLITAHYGVIDPVHRFSKSFDPDIIARKMHNADHAGFIFYEIIRSLYRFLNEELDYIENSLGHAEDRVFKGEEKEMVVSLSNTSRELLDFKNATSLHKEVLSSFESAGQHFFGKEFDFYLKDILSEYYKVHNAILASKEYLEELRTTNNSLLSTKQNETMKIFTIMAFIFLPLSFIASAFGMNTKNTPLLGVPNDFYIIVGSMVALALVTILFFKHKRWL